MLQELLGQLLISQVYEVSRLLHFKEQQKLGEFAQERESEVILQLSLNSIISAERSQQRNTENCAGFDNVAACEASVFGWGTVALPRRLHVKK